MRAQDKNDDSDNRSDKNTFRMRLSIQERSSSAVTVAPEYRAGDQVDADMISTPTNELARKRKAKASKAQQSVETGTQKLKQKQAIQPDIDSAALNRRAKELATEIQRESVMEASQEKVDRIKAAIENGTYEVDAESIAEQLMEFDFKVEDDQNP